VLAFRPIRLVPALPGGFAETPAHMLAPRLSGALGKQVFVENKPGAGGTLGADSVAKSPPDGDNLHRHAVRCLAVAVQEHALRRAQGFRAGCSVASGPYSRSTTACRRSCGLQTMSVGSA
jgi:tripartite-type tricarboxylate transporter receptor subunit TctC